MSRRSVRLNGRKVVLSYEEGGVARAPEHRDVYMALPPLHTMLSQAASSWCATHVEARERGTFVFASGRRIGGVEAYSAQIYVAEIGAFLISDSFLSAQSAYEALEVAHRAWWGSRATGAQVVDRATGITPNYGSGPEFYELLCHLRHRAGVEAAAAATARLRAKNAEVFKVWWCVRVGVGDAQIWGAWGGPLLPHTLALLARGTP